MMVLNIDRRLLHLSRCFDLLFAPYLPVHEWLEQDSDLHEENLHERIIEAAHQQYSGKVDQVGGDIMHQYERAVMLQSLDTHWREHLAALDHLRQGIHLRGYAQKKPQTGIQARGV